MNTRAAILFAIVLLGTSACEHSLAFASKARVSLHYVGTVSFGPPTTTAAGTLIPLVIDFQSGEWGRNSAKTLYGTTARQRGSMIEFSVLTSLPGGSAPVAPELHLPQLAPGDYGMVYLDPDGSTHPVGKVKIGP